MVLEELDKGGGAHAAHGGVLEVQVVAGAPSEGEGADGSESPGSQANGEHKRVGPRRSIMGLALAPFKRASNRFRMSAASASTYRRSVDEPAEQIYRESMIGPGMAEKKEADKAVQACGGSSSSSSGGRLRVVPLRWQQPVCDVLDSLGWNTLILLLTCFVVFAPDIAAVVSAPDTVGIWLNGFMIATMVLFTAETCLDLTCRPQVSKLALFLDSASNLSILFAITWVADAMGIKQDGTGSDAARAVRTVRLVRLVTVLELLSWKVKEWRQRSVPGEHNPKDQLEPSYIGRKIQVVTTLQVATVAVVIVVTTTLLVGADVETGSVEGLEAFAASIAAMAAAGVTAAGLQPTINAMLAFSEDQLGGYQVPMTLEVAGVGSWSWVEQHGGWTSRSADRVDIFEGAEGSLGAVDLSVDVQGANHRRALFNMLLSLVFILVLLAFVCTLNYSIWQLIVHPLDRIFHAIRTNASQVIQALGSQEDVQQLAGAQPGRPSAASGPGGSHRGSRHGNDFDMGTIEAAVMKMSRILEQYTSAGGMGGSVVRKMAEEADDSTKEWLATMTSEAVGSGLKRESSVRASPGATPAHASPRMSLHVAAPRRSRLGRISEIQAAQAAAAAAAAAEGSPSAARRSSLLLFQERMSQSQSGRTSPCASTALAPSEPSSSPGGGGELDLLGEATEGGHELELPAGDTLSPAASLAPGGVDLVQKHAAEHAEASATDASAVLATAAAMQPPAAPCAATEAADAAAVAVVAQRAARPRLPSGAVLGSMAAMSGGLPEDHQRLLSSVDVDYLHSFSFDALCLPQQLLAPYLCSMFLELDVAFFTGADAGPEGDKPAGFVDVATLWRFVDEVRGLYRPNTYHNFRHCVDVSHAVFMFIKRVSHKVALAPLEQFSLMVAAVSHDMDHPGVNNAFLVNAKDPLATTYNDASVLENRHVACLYALTGAKPAIDVFARLDASQWRDVRKMIIGAVLATDMVHHFPMVSRLEVFYELHAADLAAHHRALRHGLPRDALPRLFDSGEERQLLLNLILHIADISNPVRPAEIAEKWSDRVLGEFFEQGDRERSAGLPISPMCDRAKTSRAGSQVNFIEFVVAPIYAQVYKIFPELGEAVDNLLANRHFWQDALLEEIGAGPPGAAAEERTKAEKRLKDFQLKHKELLQRRRQRLERLLTGQSNLSALMEGIPGSPALSIAAFHRQGSLAALLAESASSGGGGGGGTAAGHGGPRTSSGGSTTIGVGTATMVFGKLSRLAGKARAATGSRGAEAPAPPQGPTALRFSGTSSMGLSTGERADSFTTPGAGSPAAAPRGVPGGSSARVSPEERV